MITAVISKHMSASLLPYILSILEQYIIGQPSPDHNSQQINLEITINSSNATTLIIVTLLLTIYYYKYSSYLSHHKTTIQYEHDKPLYTKSSHNGTSKYANLAEMLLLFRTIKLFLSFRFGLLYLQISVRSWRNSGLFTGLMWSPCVYSLSYSSRLLRKL